MKIKVFNRETERTFIPEGRVEIIFDRARRRTYITAAMVRQMDLKVGDYLHFLELDGKVWAVAKGPKGGGYRIGSDGRKKRGIAGLKISNTVFISFFLRKYDIQASKATFMVSRTNHEWNGNPIFEIGEQFVLNARK